MDKLGAQAVGLVTIPVTITCRRCHERETDAIYGWCRPCVREVARASRVAQGLPPTIEDPEQLRKIAVIVEAAERRQLSTAGESA